MVDVYYSRIAANTFVLFNEKNEGVLIDPGYNRGNCLIDHLNKINKDIKAILITHGHIDHIFALEDVLKLYPNAKVYISEDEKDFLENPKLNLSSEYVDEYFKTCTFVPNSLTLVNDNDIIRECGFEIKVIATPFHTRGSVCYFVESEKALFSGDTLFFSTVGRTDLPTGSSKTIQSSLKKLIELPDGVKVYPGHSACTYLDREKNHNPYLKNI